jgi:hypothetical protein
MSRHPNHEEVEPPFAPDGGAEPLRPYMGKWVVLDDTRAIRASGSTFDDAADAADRSGVSDPIFFFVPAYRLVG